MKTSMFPLLVVAGLVWATQAPAASLKVGDPAPALKVAHWIKGDPVEKLQPGQVYVVEFWATWCPPCKRSIPHLTEVAGKFEGKARVIGVSVWEREKDDQARLTKVRNFVKEMGNKMNYTVALDTPDRFMAQNWMQAAGQKGIPAAFIVGKDGRIAWIGHPMVGLEEALNKATAR